ncbi:MAG: glycosyltransferase family 2 protein [Nitrospirota bacterium]
MERFISIVIPNYNGSATIGRCIEAALASAYAHFEVIVVDDCSTDGSVEIITQYPCRLIRLSRHGGASKARNTGAFHSKGDILFFTDADCLLTPDALSVAGAIIAEKGTAMVVGGTYTPLPYDKGFYSMFQSVFINYSELKHADAPDYIATHALAIDAQVFRTSGGFAEEFLPILEDVEFSHRLRSRGYTLMMSPHLLVQHIFNYSLGASLRNAMRKTAYWVLYSLRNRDLFADSGTASLELKFNGFIYLIMLSLIVFGIATGKGIAAAFVLALLLLAANGTVSRALLAAFLRAGGKLFALKATAYYMLVYPAAIWIGVIVGMKKYLLGKHE